MKALRIVLHHRFSNERCDARFGQLVCNVGATAVVATSVVALIRHPGSRVEFFFGLGLACLVGLLILMLGTLCRGTAAQSKRPLQTRWPEFASYGVCLGLLVLGIRSLAGLGLTPAQVTLGLLLISSMSLAVLVLGMMTTAVRPLEDSHSRDSWC